MSDDRSSAAMAEPCCGIEILISDDSWLGCDAERITRHAAETAFRTAIATVADGAEPVFSIELASDERVAILNAQYRGRTGPTDVLSFPAFAPDHIASALGSAPAGMPLPLGDIIVAHGVAMRDATLEGKTLGDHLAHLIVHGTLHCLGFDHEIEEEAHIMEALERRVLALLEIADPYKLREAAP